MQGKKVLFRTVRDYSNYYTISTVPPKSVETLLGCRSSRFFEEMIEDVVEILDTAIIPVSGPDESGDFCFVSALFFDGFLTVVDEEFTVVEFIDNRDDSPRLGKNAADESFLLKARKKKCLKCVVTKK